MTVCTGPRILSSWESKNYSDKNNGSGKNNKGKTPPLIQVNSKYIFIFILL